MKLYPWLTQHLSALLSQNWLDSQRDFFPQFQNGLQQLPPYPFTFNQKEGPFPYTSNKNLEVNLIGPNWSDLGHVPTPNQTKWSVIRDLWHAYGNHSSLLEPVRAHCVMLRSSEHFQKTEEGMEWMLEGTRYIHCILGPYRADGLCRSSRMNSPTQCVHESFLIPED